MSLEIFPNKDVTSSTTPPSDTKAKKAEEHRIVPYSKTAPQTKPEQISHLFFVIIPQLYSRALDANIYASEHLRAYGKGKIFILLGTSTAGKTSIIKELMSKNPRWNESGLDMYFPLIDAKIVQKRAPVLYAKLAASMEPKYIGNAVMGDKPHFKPNSTKEEQAAAEAALKEIDKMGWFDLPAKDADNIQKAEPELYKIVAQAMEHRDIALTIFGERTEKWKQIPTDAQKKALKVLRGKKATIPFAQKEFFEEHERIMAKDAIESAVRGQDIILDTWMPEAFLNHMIETNNFVFLKIGLVYCPLTVLAERIRKRNSHALKSGNDEDYRAALMPFEQLSDFYKPAKSGDTIIDTYQRADIEKALESAFKQEKEFLKRSPLDPEANKKFDKLEKYFAETKERILTNLGFTTPAITQVNITPKHKGINYLFNTHVLESAQAADIIEEV